MKTALEEFDRLVELIIDDAYETEEYKELKKDLDDLGISGEISELIALFNEAGYWRLSGQLGSHGYDRDAKAAGR